MQYVQIPKECPIVDHYRRRHSCTGSHILLSARVECYKSSIEISAWHTCCCMLHIHSQKLWMCIYRKCLKAIPVGEKQTVNQQKVSWASKTKRKQEKEENWKPCDRNTCLIKVPNKVTKKSKQASRFGLLIPPAYLSKANQHTSSEERVRVNWA